MSDKLEQIVAYIELHSGSLIFYKKKNHMRPFFPSFKYFIQNKSKTKPKKMIRQLDADVLQPQTKRQRLEIRVREIVENPGEVLRNGSNTSAQGFRKAVQRLVKSDEDSKNIYNSTSKSSIKTAIKLCADEFPTHDRSIAQLVVRQHEDILNDDDTQADDKFDQVYAAATNAMKAWLDARLINMPQPSFKHTKKSRCISQMKETLQKTNDPIKTQQDINLVTMMTARFPNRRNHVDHAKETIQTRHITDYDDAATTLIPFESGLSADLAFVAVKPDDSDHDRIDPNNDSRQLICSPIELKSVFTLIQRRRLYRATVHLFAAKNNDLVGIVDILQLDSIGDPYPLIRLLIANIGAFRALVDGNGTGLHITLKNVQVDQETKMITDFEFGETTQSLLNTAVERNILTVRKRPDVADVWSNGFLYSWLKQQPAPATPMTMGDISSGSPTSCSGNVREQMLAKAILDSNTNLDRIRTPLETHDPIDLLFRKHNDDDDDEKHGDCRHISVSSRYVGFKNKNIMTPYMLMTHCINGQTRVPLTLENANDVLCAIQPVVDDEETLTATNSPNGTVSHIYVFPKTFVFGHADYHGGQDFRWKLGEHLDKLVYLDGSGETINTSHQLFAF